MSSFITVLKTIWMYKSTNLNSISMKVQIKLMVLLIVHFCVLKIIIDKNSEKCLFQESIGETVTMVRKQCCQFPFIRQLIGLISIVPHFLVHAFTHTYMPICHSRKKLYHSWRALFFTFFSLGLLSKTKEKGINKSSFLQILSHFTPIQLRLRTLSVVQVLFDSPV